MDLCGAVVAVLACLGGSCSGFDRVEAVVFVVGVGSEFGDCGDVCCWEVVVLVLAAETTVVLCWWWSQMIC